MLKAACHAGSSISGRSSYFQSPPRKLPRWKGRTPYPFPNPPVHPSHDPSHPSVAQQPDQDPASSVDGQFYTSSSGQAPEAPGNCPSSDGLCAEKYKLLHQLMQSLQAGQVQRVRQQLEDKLGKDALQKDPELCFELHR